VCEFVPPSFAVPFIPCYAIALIIHISVEDGRSIEIKYVKKGIIVKDGDQPSMWALPLGVLGCTSADFFSVWKGSRNGGRPGE